MPLRVGVLFGGQSEERSISMMSARSVMQAMQHSYDITPIAIDRDGQWIIGNDALDLMAAVTGDAPRLSAVGHPVHPAIPIGRGTDRDVPFRPEAFTGLVDVIVPVLHGPLGEDGTVQGLLELTGLPYVGSGVLGSALGMDKIAMKMMFHAMGIPQVAYRGLMRHTWVEQRDRTLDMLEHALAYPIFVKPANLGSSVGISKATDRRTLKKAIDEAQRFDRRVIIEQSVDAREFEVGVLGWQHPTASVVGEVILHGHEFYDYRAKYEDGIAELSIPADIPVDVAQQMQELAVEAFQAFDCAGLARVDFFWERSSGRVLVNEINTLPGFTPYSMYPVLWQATGVSYSQLLARLIDIAFQRHEQSPRQLKP